jgi:hypothetical protein
MTNLSFSCSSNARTAFYSYSHAETKRHQKSSLFNVSSLQETVMNKFTRIALPIVLSMTAATAMASEFTPEAPFVSTLSRAEVRAEAIAARDAGLIASGEFGPVIVAENTSSLTRAQVRAEAVEAQRLGLLASGEITVLPTPAQLEQVRLAGLRVVQGENLAQGKNQRVTN